MFSKNVIYVAAALVLAAWGSTSAVEGIVIEGGLTHEQVVQPGKTVTGVIVIKNESDVEKGINIYKTDYLFYADGTNKYGKPGTMPRSCANWVRHTPSRTFIKPHSESEIFYTVKVPEVDTLAGTYWCIFMVEPIPDNLVDPEVREKSVGVRVKWRYGVQLVLQMGNTGTKEMQFTNTSLVKNNEKRILQVDIENTGEKWLKPLVWVELFRADGTVQGKYSSTVMRCYPETSIRHEFDLTGVPQGTYKALIVADCGDDDLFGINYTIKLGEEQ